MRTTSGQYCKLDAVRTAQRLLESSLRMMEDLTKFDDPEDEDCNYMDEVKRALAAIVHEQWAHGGLLFQSFESFRREKLEEIAAAKTWKQVAEYCSRNSALYTVRDKHLCSYGVSVSAFIDIAQRLLRDERNGDRQLHDELMNNNKESVA
jgi:hypothetical protein